MFITFILVAILSIVLIYVFQVRNRDPNNFYWSVNGPLQLPIVGNAWVCRDPDKLLETNLDLLKKYGNRFRLSILNLKGIVTTDYKMFDLILNSNVILTKSLNYNYLYPWIGTGLLISSGEKWKKHRKFLTPAFHFGILKQFIPIMENDANILLEKFEQIYEKSRSIDIHPLISLYTLDVICETAMGTKLNAQINETSEYVQSVKEMCRILTERILRPLEVYEPTFRFTSNYRKQKNALRILHNYSETIIKQKLQNRKNGTQATDESHLHGTKKKIAFLDLLIELTDNETELTPEELREEVDTFMFAGHDTTATAISFALYSLANHPEFQQKAFEEQEELFGDDEEQCITHEILSKMKYLELVIKETMRLYPSVPAIGRVTTSDFEFEGKIIPPNTNLVLFIIGMHRNPEYFPEPEKFRPERFLGNHDLLPFAYVPFSAGSRNCIGQKFAMLEMKTVLSKILRRFILEPAYPKHDLKLRMYIVLSSSTGVKIALKPRKSNIEKVK